MGWENFRELFIKGNKDEAHFILGIDLGNYSSSIAYFDLNQKTSEVIDISGGYGKPNIPTVIQYVEETKEWVFGEYAITNGFNERAVTIHSLIEKLGKSDYIDIIDKTVSIKSILTLFFKELIGNCKNINPKAEISGFVVSTHSYMSEVAKDELKDIFKNSGYEKSFITFVDDRESIINKYYFDKPVEEEKLLIIDFGGREIRGGVYNISPYNLKDKGEITIDCQSFFFDKAIGATRIDKEVEILFQNIFCDHFGIEKEKLTEEQINQIASFAYMQRDTLFQRKIMTRPIKLYFNFTYPPFQAIITQDIIDKLLYQYKIRFKEFLQSVILKPTLFNQKISIEEIRTVICVGGGFEMLWARDIINDFFIGKNIVFYRNSKGVISEGSSIIAAKLLGAIVGAKFSIRDTSKIDYDLGIMPLKNKKETFISIVDSNSFWWQEHSKRHLILNNLNENISSIMLYSKNKVGEITKLKDIDLDDLPIKPNAATRLEISLDFFNTDSFKVSIKDLGFGDLFPSSGYYKEVICNNLQ